MHHPNYLFRYATSHATSMNKGKKPISISDLVHYRLYLLVYLTNSTQWQSYNGSPTSKTIAELIVDIPNDECNNKARCTAPQETSQPAPFININRWDWAINIDAPENNSEDH